MTEHLVMAVYDALGRGDAEALDEVLAPDFVARFADGMPVGAGRHEGREAARRDGWWAIGAAFSARAEPIEHLDCGPGRLITRGRYRGTARATGAVLDAAFFHLWTSRDGVLVELEQLTDTARWQAALA